MMTSSGLGFLGLFLLGFLYRGLLLWLMLVLCIGDMMGSSGDMGVPCSPIRLYG